MMTKLSHAGLFLGVLTSLLFTLPARQAQGTPPSIYLTSGRIYAPGERPELAIESPEALPALDLRIYRIEDPEAFFQAQKDLHRPGLERRASLSPLSLMKQIVVAGMNAERKAAYHQMSPEARRHFAQRYPKAALSARMRPKQPSEKPKQAPPYPLVARWTTTPPAQSPKKDAGWKRQTHAQRIKLPLHDAGVYLVEAEHDEAYGQTLVMVSDISLVTKQSDRELLVWTVDTRSGQPIGQVDLKVFSGGKPVGQTQSDAQGLARLPIEQQSKLVIYAQKNGSFSLLDPSYYPASFDLPRAYLFTSRPVYRQDQTVELKGFFRAQDRGKLTALPAELTRERVKITVEDPQGERILSLTADLSDSGSFDTAFQLAQHARHGVWTATAELNGRRYSAEFKVMSFLKPEVRLTINPELPAVRSGSPVRGHVRARYFYGAPYTGQKVRIHAFATRFEVPWYVNADYNWYYSESEYRRSARILVAETVCQLDPKGECAFSFDTQVGLEDYAWTLEASTLGPKSETVLGQSRIQVTRGEVYLSFADNPVLIKPGKSTRFQVIANRFDRKKEAISVNLRVLRRIVDPATNIPESTEAYNQSSQSDGTGLASFALSLPDAGYYEVVAEAADAMGHRTQSKSFLFVSDAEAPVEMAPPDLSLVPDKKIYQVGDTLQLLVLTPSREASVLFTVEGQDIAQAKVIASQGHSAVVSIPITENQTPNFFVSAASLMGGEVYTRTRSIVVPPKERLLKVRVLPEKPVMKPGEKASFTIEVKDHLGQPVRGAELAVSVVDEAIYDISPELGPEIGAFFYPRRRNNVRTTDSHSLRFFGRTQLIDNRLARATELDRNSPFVYGSMKSSEEARSPDFDAAAWFPKLVTNELGQAIAAFKLPRHMTTWRATARAITEDSRVGSATGEMIVTQALVADIAVPEQLFEGDLVQAQLSLHNTTASQAKVDLSLGMTKDSGLTLKSSIPASLEVAPGEVKTIPVRFEASKPGHVKLELSAKASFKQGAPVEDVARIIVKVAKWQTEHDESQSGMLSGTGAKVDLAFDTPKASHDHELKMAVSLSPLFAVEGSLPGLIAYPYGCVEQTMSRFVPLMAAKAVLAESNMKLPDPDRIDVYASEGLQRLANMQLENGGWGWVIPPADPQMSAVVMEGLTEARTLGLSIDDALMNRGLDFLEAQLQDPEAVPSNRPLVLYVLARNGRARPAMLRSELSPKRMKQHNPIALSYLLLTAVETQQSRLTETLLNALTAETQMTLDPETQAASWCRDIQGPDAPLVVHCTALALTALSKAKAPEALLEAAVQGLIQRYDGEGFGNTWVTGLAVRALLLAKAASAKPEAITLWLKDTKLFTHAFTDTTDPKSTPTLETIQAVPQTDGLQLSQTGEGQSFYSLRMESQETSERMAPIVSKKLSITREYRKLVWREGALHAGPKSQQFESGEMLLVDLIVRSKKPLEHLLIEDPHPAGFKPVINDSSIRVEKRRFLPQGVFREHRDHHTALLVRKLDRGTTVYSYVARATHPGSYRALPAEVVGMYDKQSDGARTHSDQLTIKPATAASR